MLGEHVNADYLEFLEDMQISYVFAGSDGMDLDKAMENLCRDFGIHRISLQGGGIVNGSFFRVGLVDELSIVVCPRLDGWQGAPGIIECQGKKNNWPQRLTLKLLGAEKLDADCVWLHYRVYQ